MSPFRHVEGDRAGSSALGVLVPPAKRTFLILRPRSLPFDLLLVANPSTALPHVLRRAEASAAVRRLLQILNEGGWFLPDRVEARPAPDGQGLWLWADVEDFAFLACAREEGKPYKPLVYSDVLAADAAAAALAAVLRPTAAGQELYVNTNYLAV
jgi:hypothetical protein